MRGSSRRRASCVLAFLPTRGPADGSPGGAAKPLGAAPSLFALAAGSDQGIGQPVIQPSQPGGTHVMGNRINSVLSLTALVVAVGGATPLGEAAWNQVVPRNSVGTLQLKRNAVKSSKIAPNVVRTAHVVNGSLLVEDFRPGQIP